MHTNDSSIHTTAELDSHADTCTFGQGARIVRETGHTISVDGFNEGVGTLKNIPIVTAAVAYDDPNSQVTYILFYHQSLYIKSLKKHLLCPEQMRRNQVEVNLTPLTHIQEPDRRHTDHSIIYTDPHTLHTMHIPLELHGTTSLFYVRTPTHQEVASDENCIHVHVTSESTWEPYDETFYHDEDTIHLSLDSELHVRGRELNAISTESTKP